MTDDELAEITARTERANHAWVEGEWDNGYGAFISHADDVSIYGPFGGPLTLGGKEWAARGPHAVKQFSNGTSKLNDLARYQSGDLLVLVTLEDQTADIGGKANHPWTLRTTQVYRRENGEWKIVHRHADPLIRFRPTEETLALAS
jgi:ketosteroid isomerase-like protein